MDYDDLKDIYNDNIDDENIEDDELEYDENEQLDQLSDNEFWNKCCEFVINEKENDNINKNDKELNNIKCDNCGSNQMIFIVTNSNYTCSDCGMVGNDIFYDKAEWNNYEDNKNDLQRGGTINSHFFPKTSLGTDINKNIKINTIHKWHQMPYKERSLLNVLKNIDEKCKKYKITKAIIDTAKYIYKSVIDTIHLKGKNIGRTVIIRGTNRRKIIAGSVYFACNIQNKARTTLEIAEIFELSKAQITNGNKKIRIYLPNHILLSSSKVQKATDFINRHGNNINLDNDILELANLIAKNSIEIQVGTNHKPESIAAASTYIAIIKLNEKNKLLDSNNLYDENKFKKNIMKEYNLSEVTINKTRDNILLYIDIIMSNDKTFLYNNNLCEAYHDIGDNDDIISDSNNSNNIILDLEEFKKKLNIDINNTKEDIDLNNIIIFSKEKKKRGRKPKILSNSVKNNYESIDSSDTNIIYSDNINNIKKRGRPRKIDKVSIN